MTITDHQHDFLCVVKNGRMRLYLHDGPTVFGFVWPDMTKVRRSVRKARMAARRRWRTEVPTVSARRMAFAILVEGGQPEQVAAILQWCGLRVPSMKTVYDEMRTVCRRIIKMAQNSMRAKREQMLPNTIISFDGSWDHRRNGKRCLFTVINSSTGAIIESVVLSKKPNSPSQILCEESNMMEAKGLEVAVERLRNDPNIVAYVHDNDAKARRIIGQAGWEIFEYLDPGHCLKSFERKLQNFERKNNGILRGIEGTLKHWVWILISTALPVEQKVQLWQNTVHHMCGDHSRCLPHAPMGVVWDNAATPGAPLALKKFLDRTQFIIERCCNGISTQANESFHRKKLKYASKDIRWGFTWEARMMAAVLSKNMPGWKLQLYRSLGLTGLPERFEISIRRKEIECYGRSMLIRTDPLRARRRARQPRQGQQNAAHLARPNPLAYARNPYIPA